MNDSCSICALADRLSAHRRRAHGALQLAATRGGTAASFVLRIEDTDTERSSWEMVAGIVDGLRWLGLDWDEGPDVGGPHAPYFQSQRVGSCASPGGTTGVGWSRILLLLQRRDAAAEAPGGGGCRRRVGIRPDLLRASALTKSPRERLPGRRARFDSRCLPGTTSFTDLVHGPIAFDNAHIEDFVVLRSDDQPTYHLSVVADDMDMAITHVVRGDDHISNTPKQVLLYQAFGAAHPQFAHVPLILGPDKKRLSKRHGATSVMEYQRLGYLPEAMVNFLALLGWSPGDDRELFTRDELIAAFTLDGHQRRQRRLQSGEARLVQSAAHPAVAARRIGAACRARIARGGALDGRARRAPS